jgi:hypothetical protein
MILSIWKNKIFLLSRMSQNTRMKPTGISWQNAPRGTAVPNTKFTAASHIYETHAAPNYNRKNPQTAQQFAEGQRNVLASKITEGPLAAAMSRLTLGKGRKTRRRSRKHRKTRRGRKN